MKILTLSRIAFLLITIITISCRFNEESDNEISFSNQDYDIRRFYNSVFYDKSIPNNSIANQILKYDSLRIKNKYYKAAYDVAKAAYYNKTMSFKIAEYHFLNGLSTLKNTPNDTIAERAYVGLSNLYKNKGEFAKSLMYLQKGINACEANKDTIRLAGAYASMSQLLFEKNEVDNAQKSIEKVFTLLQNKKSEIPYLIALHTLANIELKSGNAEKAFLYDRQGLKIADSIHSDKLRVTFQDNLARYYLFKKDYANAEIYFTKNLEIDIKLNNPNWIADSNINLAELYIQKNDFKKAEAKLKTAIAILSEKDLSNNMLKAQSVLEDLYKKQGDFKKALEAKEAYIVFYKKLINEKNEAVFAELDVLFETNKKEEALAKAQLTLAENEITSKRKSIYLLLLGGFIFIGFVLFRNYQSKSKLQKEQLVLENKLLEEQSNFKIQEQRIDISRELHDNVGAQLTFIISILDNFKSNSIKFDETVNKKIDSLSSFANKSISELRDSIWILNADQLSISELKSKILNFIKDAGESKEDINFKIDFEIQKDHDLSSKQAINIFRVVQEIINNSIKHSKGTEISFNGFVENDAIRIEISDNGIGFDYSASHKKSFGLTNISKRIQEINGTINVLSEEHKGTVYTITVAL